MALALPQEMPPVRTFILSHLAVFKTECSRLTYGRVTAMRYFLRFLGIEKRVEEGRGIETAGEAPAATRNSPGRARCAHTHQIPVAFA